MLWIACQFPSLGCDSLRQPIPPESAQLQATESFASVLQRMAGWALQFTPDVCMGQTSTVLLLEVEPSLRLWGGLHALLQRLQEGWQSLGWHPPNAAHLAWAPTPRAAEWRALWRAESEAPLEQLPLGCIPEAHPHLDLLARMGLQHLGSLVRLPREGLAQRTSPALLEALDAGLGRRPDPRSAVQPALKFCQTLEFPQATDQLGLLMLGAERLLEGCLGWLRSHQRGLRRLSVQLLQGHQQPYTRLDLEVELADPSQDPLRIQRLLRERLGQKSLASPVHSMALEVLEHEALTLAITDLFEGPQRQTEGLHRLLERLTSRLGPQQVLQLSTHDTLRPEEASSLRPIRPGSLLRSGSGSPSAPTPEPLRRPRTGPALATGRLPSGEPPRPAWLLPEPLPLAQKGPRPCYQGPLRLRVGPERLESDWWEGDRIPLQRDYFVAETQDQRLVWVFRTPDHQWFLHGLFG